MAAMPANAKRSEKIAIAEYEVAKTRMSNVKTTRKFVRKQINKYCAKDATVVGKIRHFKQTLEQKRRLSERAKAAARARAAKASITASSSRRKSSASSSKAETDASSGIHDGSPSTVHCATELDSDSDWSGDTLRLPCSVGPVRKCITSA